MASRSRRCAGLSTYNEDELEASISALPSVLKPSATHVGKKRGASEAKAVADAPVPRFRKQVALTPSSELVSLPTAKPSAGRAIGKSPEHLETDKFYRIGAYEDKKMTVARGSKPRAFDAQGWHAYMVKKAGGSFGDGGRVSS